MWELCIMYKNKLYKILCKNYYNNLLKVQVYKTYRKKPTKIKTIPKKNLKTDFKIVITK